MKIKKRLLINPKYLNDLSVMQNKKVARKYGVSLRTITNDKQKYIIKEEKND
jgi:hypothetical protein